MTPKMNYIPKKEIACRKEFAEFRVLLTKALKHRGKHRQQYLNDIDDFFCNKIVEITMRQRGYFTEVLQEKQELKRKIKSLENEVESLRRDQQNQRQRTLSLKDIQTRIKNLEKDQES